MDFTTILPSLMLSIYLAFFGFSWHKGVMKKLNIRWTKLILSKRRAFSLRKRQLEESSEPIGRYTLIMEFIAVLSISISLLSLLAFPINFSIVDELKAIVITINSRLFQWDIEFLRASIVAVLLLSLYVNHLVVEKIKSYNQNHYKKLTFSPLTGSVTAPSFENYLGNRAPNPEEYMSQGELDLKYLTADTIDQLQNSDEYQARAKKREIEKKALADQEDGLDLSDSEIFLEFLSRKR